MVEKGWDKAGTWGEIKWDRGQSGVQPSYTATAHIISVVENIQTFISVIYTSSEVKMFFLVVDGFEPISRHDNNN